MRLDKPAVELDDLDSEPLRVFTMEANASSSRKLKLVLVDSPLRHFEHFLDTEIWTVLKKKERMITKKPEWYFTLEWVLSEEFHRRLSIFLGGEFFFEAKQKIEEHIVYFHGLVSQVLRKPPIELIVESLKGGMKTAR